MDYEYIAKKQLIIYASIIALSTFHIHVCVYVCAFIIIIIIIITISLSLRLSIRSLLEPPASLTSQRARSDPIQNPFRAKQRLNPFYLPWGMRGIADEIMARGDQILIKELDRVKRLYNDWNPVSKAMKEVKFRLEPVRSKL
jgi:hypothetical protein